MSKHGLYVVYTLHLKIEFRSCAFGVSGVALFITIGEQLQQNRASISTMLS